MKSKLNAVKGELADIAVSMGAIDARVADLNALQGPLSADPTYVLPEAQSVMAFAVPLGNDFIPDYFGKKTRVVFKQIMYDVYQLIGKIGEKMASLLVKKGYQAFSPSPNAVYRRQESGGGFQYPDFSHRYAAVASGLGAFGWSGNVMVKDHWSAVFLGSVVTDAVLPPDQPSEAKLCDNCRICARVCPLEYIQLKAKQKVNLGGREYVYNAKGHQMRCALACSGFVGRSRDRKWSSWATLDYEFPQKDDELLGIFIKAIQDPQTLPIRQHIGINPDSKFSEWAREAANSKKGVLLRSLEDTHPTCCNCLLVCSGPLEWRNALMKTLHASGVVIRTEDGREEAVKPR